MNQILVEIYINIYNFFFFFFFFFKSGFQWHNLTIKDNIPEPTFHYHSIPIQFLPTKELEGIHSVDMVIGNI